MANPLEMLLGTSNKDMALNLERVADGLEELNENLNYIIDLAGSFIEAAEAEALEREAKVKK